MPRSPVSSARHGLRGIEHGTEEDRPADTVVHREAVRGERLDAVQDGALQRVAVRRCTLTYMARLTVTQARSILPELLDRVAGGEEITITRHGEAVAVVLRPDAVRVRRAAQTIERAQEIRDLVLSARDQQLPPAGVSAKRADELVESIRAGRDRS